MLAHIFTVKRGTTGVARTEVEVDLQPEQFAALWPLTAGRRVVKTRYEIPDGDGKIELDVYHRDLRGLLTAEREFGSLGKSEAWKAPTWFGLEVTEDNRYKNHMLALKGVPES